MPWWVWILQLVVDRIISWASSLARKEKAKEEAHKDHVKKAEEDLKKSNELKPDSSSKDADEAIDDALSHL